VSLDGYLFSTYRHKEQYKIKCNTSINLYSSNISDLKKDTINLTSQKFVKELVKNGTFIFLDKYEFDDFLFRNKKETNISILGWNVIKRKSCYQHPIYDKWLHEESKGIIIKDTLKISTKKEKYELRKIEGEVLHLRIYKGLIYTFLPLAKEHKLKNKRFIDVFAPIGKIGCIHFITDSVPTD